MASVKLAASTLSDRVLDARRCEAGCGALQRRRAPRSAPTIVCMLGVAAMLSSADIPMVSSEAGPADGATSVGVPSPFYTILVDAGSSGSRVHVFRMRSDEAVRPKP
ncbi:hypothetical protein T484DRAFT_1795972 [Baffinella frigidus]|nr:hypothetical protein T484DRAFT_1795972 [Cryptophyta sp. CCMP2293]